MEFRKWLIEEAAKKDSRKGVAFKQKALDDLETGVFASRLADKLGTKPSGGNYGDFLYHSVRSQGDVLGDLNWEKWEVTKAAMELGGVNPSDINDPNKSLADRLALVNRINWQNVTLPALKAKLGPSFKVPDDWKRQFGIERLKRIKAAVEQGQPITDPKERRLLGIWRTLEVQLGGEDDQPSQILPAGPRSDVGMTKLPMSRTDRTRFYKTLTGTNENAEAPLQLSAQSAYDYLTRYGMEVVTDDEATDLYLNRILNDLRNKGAFIPSSPRGQRGGQKTMAGLSCTELGWLSSSGQILRPGNDPGFAQWLAGMTTRGFKMRTNPSGRRVPAGYNEPEEVAARRNAGDKILASTWPRRKCRTRRSMPSTAADARGHLPLLKRIDQACPRCRELVETERLGHRPGEVGRLRSAGRHGNAGSHRLSPELAVQRRIPACHRQHVGSTVCLAGLADGQKRKRGGWLAGRIILASRPPAAIVAEARTNSAGFGAGPQEQGRRSREPLPSCWTRILPKWAMTKRSSWMP